MPHRHAAARQQRVHVDERVHGSPLRLANAQPQQPPQPPLPQPCAAARRPLRHSPAMKMKSNWPGSSSTKSSTVSCSSGCAGGAISTLHAVHLERHVALARLVEPHAVLDRAIGLAGARRRAAPASAASLRAAAARICEAACRCQREHRRSFTDSVFALGPQQAGQAVALLLRPAAREDRRAGSGCCRAAAPRPARSGGSSRAPAACTPCSCEVGAQEADHLPVLLGQHQALAGGQRAREGLGPVVEVAAGSLRSRSRRRVPSTCTCGPDACAGHRHRVIVASTFRPRARARAAVGAGSRAPRAGRARRRRSAAPRPTARAAQVGVRGEQVVHARTPSCRPSMPWPRCTR